ncbi:hypothetical protein [Bacillus thuringiensis]|uniref:hypothetical protein n=1 Tax=Bacillus thuringiensis TaxID=1428 RepID=UPI00159BC50C|nr:hypothetical protein [Bacillus thuringiensis]
MEVGSPTTIGNKQFWKLATGVFAVKEVGSNEEPKTVRFEDDEQLAFVEALITEVRSGK